MKQKPYDFFNQLDKLYTESSDVDTINEDTQATPDDAQIEQPAKTKKKLTFKVILSERKFTPKGRHNT